MPKQSKQIGWYETPLRKMRKFLGIPRAGVEGSLHRAVSKVLPKKGAPEVMARGGEHLVLDFGDSKHSDVMYKVNFHQSLKLLKAAQAGGMERERAIQAMKEEIERRRGKLDRLRQHVGFAAVPAQQVMIREVPVTEEVTDALRLPKDKIGPDIPESVPAWIVVQRKIELGSQDVSLNAYYPEASFNAYGPEQEAGHEALVGGAMGEFDPERQLEAVLSLYSDMRYLNGCAERDPEFKQALRKVTEEMIKFSRENDTALDLAGRNNVVLMKTEDGWDLKMPDPLPPGDVRISDLEKAAEAFGTGSMAGIKWDNVLNALNSVRVLNAMALISGSSERLRVPGLDRLSGDFFLERFKPFFHAEEN